MLQNNQERRIEIHSLMHWNSPRIYQEITKMGCTEKISPVLRFFLRVHNYHSWDSPSFVGFKEHRACILQNSPWDAKCTGPFRVTLECWELLSPTRKETSYSDQTLTFASHSKKNSEGCPSNQVSVAAMTSALDEEWRPFNCFFSRVGLRTYQHPCKDMTFLTAHTNILTFWQW